MRVVLEVGFKNMVKIPTGVKGQARAIERMLIDHPESPHKDHVFTWDPSARMLTVRHAREGFECVVPVENISYMRFAEDAPTVAKKVA